MNTAALAALLLASAYFFLRRWRVTHSLLMRSDGNPLYFLIILGAVPLGLFVATVATSVHASWLGPYVSSIFETILAPLPFEPLVESRIRYLTPLALFAPVCSFVLAGVLNAPLRRCSSLLGKIQDRWAVISEVEAFLKAATDREMPVMVTTGTGKVYVGWSVAFPTKGHAKKWIRLQPMLSGYRDVTQQFQPTTNYAWIRNLPYSGNGVVERIYREDFDVIIPIEEIKSVHHFDAISYATRFNAAPNALSTPPTSSVLPASAILSPAPPSHSPRPTVKEASGWFSLSEWGYWIYAVLVSGIPLSWQYGWAAIAAIGVAATFSYWIAVKD